LPGNSREPTRYIGELSEFASDKLRFKTVDANTLDRRPFADHLHKSNGTPETTQRTRPSEEVSKARAS
jgi:hypothetical protein